MSLFHEAAMKIRKKSIQLAQDLMPLLESSSGIITIDSLTVGPTSLSLKRAPGSSISAPPYVRWGPTGLEFGQDQLAKDLWPYEARDVYPEIFVGTAWADRPSLESLKSFLEICGPLVDR
jgi:hypothetical protein